MSLATRLVALVEFSNKFTIVSIKFDLGLSYRDKRLTFDVKTTLLQHASFAFRFKPRYEETLNIEKIFFRLIHISHTLSHVLSKRPCLFEVTEYVCVDEWVVFAQVRHLMSDSLLPSQFS